MADIKETIAVEKRLNRQGRGALKDILGKVIAEYNKFCSNKRHRIDSTRRSLIYNLFFNLHSETFSNDFLGTNWYPTLTRFFFHIGCYRYQATMPGRSHTDVAWPLRPVQTWGLRTWLYDFWLSIPRQTGLILSENDFKGVV